MKKLICDWGCEFISLVSDGFVECSKFDIFLKKCKKTNNALKCKKCKKGKKK